MMRIRKLSAALLCSSALFAGYSFATPEHNLSFQYDLPVNSLQTIKGNVLSTRVIDCHVRSEGNESNPLALVSLKKQSVVNGLIIPEGSSASLVVRVGDRIHFELKPRAKLGVTNNGANLINLDCN